jgi:FAD synthetase
MTDDDKGRYFATASATVDDARAEGAGGCSASDGKQVRRRVEEADCSTAGIIIIGDEILNGQTRDVNTAYLAGKLHSMGIRVLKVSVIPDQVDVIAQEVRDFCVRYSIVLTSGGIGPTHDDVTFEAVAAAFDDRIEYNDYLVDFVEKWFKTSDRSKPCFKLAQIPSLSKLNFSSDGQNRFPLISVENVYVFPGIPHLLRKGFETVGGEIFARLSSRRFYMRKVFVDCCETDIAERLNSLVAKYPNVSFGSYPDLFNIYYKTKITLETTSQELADEVLKEVESVLPTVKFDSNPTQQVMEKIKKLRTACADGGFVNALDEALATVIKCLSDYKPDEVTICFNGGKDCIVMLHLIHSVMTSQFPGSKIQAFYVREKNPFDEIEDFVDKASKAYDLDLVTFDGPMKVALAKLLTEKPNIKATVLGTRTGDPGSQYLKSFSVTDGDWPRVMRVNPILSWEYAHIWKFLRDLNLDYPVLYDQGYSSLGSKDNTDKNDALKYIDAYGKEKFKPAYELKDGTQERNGRVKK